MDWKACASKPAKVVDEDRIETVGFGESKPAFVNGTLDGRKANRRVEIIFVE